MSISGIKKYKHPNSTAVVIPVYKAHPTEFELSSFIQCLKILYKYKIYLICSKTLNVTSYTSLVHSNNINISIIHFNEKYFNSMAGYNSLMQSLILYFKFLSHKHILIYQLDSWVFRDELDLWVSQKYDYIGAPWFQGWHNADEHSKIIGVGNGGFSLRRTKSFIKLYFITILYKYLGKAIFLKSKFKFLNTDSPLFRSNDKIEVIRRKEINEDLYIFNLSECFKWFKIAPFNEAIKFSFEANPEILHAENGYRLPFGCHAWERYNYTFWKQFIKLHHLL